MSVLLEVFTEGVPKGEETRPEAVAEGRMLDVEDFERTADRAGFLAAMASGARFVRDGRVLSGEEVLEILDSFEE